MTDLDNALFYRSKLIEAEEKLRRIKLQADYVLEGEADLENDAMTEWTKKELEWQREELLTMCQQCDWDLDRFKDYINFRRTHRQSSTLEKEGV